MSVLARNRSLSKLEFYMTAEDCEQQYRAWRGDKKRYNAYKTLKSMDLYKRRQSSWTKSKEKS